MPSTAPNSHAQPAIPLLPKSLDNALTDLRNSFKTEVLEFQSLRELTLEQILNDFHPGQNRLIDTFKKLCLLTKLAMHHMNEKCPALPNDSMQRTLELFSHPGSKVVVLSGILPRNNEPTVLGYGVMMVGRENIIDAYHIPNDLLKESSACRVIRLFVTNESREFLPRGEAFNEIIERIKQLSGEGLLIGMVLTDIQSVSGNKVDPSIWLEAKTALDSRGFHKAGMGPIEDINDSRIIFEWWTWSKNSPPTSSQQKLELKVADLEHYKRRRLTPLTHSVPTSSGRISVHGRAVHSFDIARAYPGNIVVSPQYETNSKLERAHNLTRVKANQEAVYADPGSLDASIVMGSLPDIINLHGGDPKQAVLEFLKSQHSQLALGGSLVVRDTVAPEQDQLVRLRVAGKEAGIWNNFLSAKAESHIAPESWAAVTKLGSQNDAKSTWLAPLSIVQEFLNKFSYSNEKQTRLYTSIKASELRAMLEAAGFRINFESPIRDERFENRTFEGRIEILDQAGNKKEFPSLSYLAIAEKIDSSDVTGVSVQNDESLKDPRFLKIKRFHKINESGEVSEVQEIAARKNQDSVTLDVLPFFIRKEEGTDRLYFAGRITPRPLVALSQDSSVDSSYSNIFHVEQVGAIFDKQLLNTNLEIAERSIALLKDRANISRTDIRDFTLPTAGFTRADTVDELVYMQSVQVNKSYWEGIIANRIYDLETLPKLKTFEASRYLQGCQTGVFQDRRLELMVYQAGLASKANLGDWLGDPLYLKEQKAVKTSDLKDIMAAASKSVFRASNIPFPMQFFDVRRATFIEETRSKIAKGHATLEYVKPLPSQGFGQASISVLPIVKQNDEIFVGLEVRDFASVYLHTKNPSLLTLPTFRIPNKSESYDESARWTARRLAQYFGVSTSALHKLGGKYLVSPGMTPDVIQPTVCEVVQTESQSNSLQWVSLKQLLLQASELKCLQLRTSVYRAAHMFGLIK